MFQRVSKHITPATILASVALVFAVTGGAFAASGSGGNLPAKATAPAAHAATAKKKPGSKGKAGPRGPAGPKGAAGATGATGPAGATGPGGPQGPAGANATNGEKGEQGVQGIRGKEGERGETGASAFEPLPGERTETGLWAINTPSPSAYVPISFSIPLSGELAAADVHFVTEEEWKKEGGKTPPAGCVGGTGASPTAEPGNLCVYVTVESPGEFVEFLNPGGITNGAGKSGTLFFLASATSVSTQAGTWAVTAP